MPRVVEGNKVPLYRQLATSMMQRIRTGDYQVGQPLPPIRLISREFKVSVTVVQQAIRDLEQRGLVVAQHGKQVMVTGTKAADRAALIFGLVHPYAEGLSFGRDVLHFATRAFAERNNLLIPVSSDGEAAKEREQIEHLSDNGVRGLIVWPVPSDDNAAFLEEMSQRTPIVLVDRLVRGCSLPAVTHDTFTAGKDICDHFFTRCKKRRLLAVLDNLDISPYEDMLRGMRGEARLLGREDDFTTIQLPISDLVQQFNRSDFSGLGQTAEYVERVIDEGGYDALFCYHEDLLDYVAAQTGILDRHPTLSIGATRSGDINIRSWRYVEASPTTWRLDHVGAISAAADRLQEITILKRPFTKRIALPLVCNQPAD